jgi:23S rRNA (pseudouridine1915-N3)-methyltransferase
MARRVAARWFRSTFKPHNGSSARGLALHQGCVRFFSMKVFVYFVGKPRDEHANAIAEEFLKRTSRWAACQMREIAADTPDPWAKHTAAVKIALDPAGKVMDSPKLAGLFRGWEDSGQDVVFVIGGHDGLLAAWRARADVLLLSLSAMTFPHELARAMLTEQIYRALATLRGHPYPR